MSNVERDRASAGTLEIAVFHGGHAWCAEVQDDAGTRRVTLAGSRGIVGTSKTADVPVVDATVSGKHLALAVERDGVVLSDLGSKNGTFVGGARVKEAKATAGTTIVIGRSTVTLRAMERDASSDDDAEPLAGVAGGSIVMRRIAACVRRVAAHGVPVLVTGETGTGKELVARAVHTEGARARGPFVALNVASLPRDLVESELFGHERGAFTGAVSRRAGAFSEADGGTLFLDEIGDLPLDAQPKLLRALDGYDVRRVGATGKGRAPDVRIVAATNRALVDRVSDQLFRADLFHRLSVFTISLPPLRQRRGDIGPIARAILVAAPNGLGRRELTPRALARLVAHDWPGNVRELRSVLYRASDHARTSGIIDLEHVEEAVHVANVPPANEIGRRQAQALLDEHRGNITAAARAAGVPRSTFRKRLHS
jgi:DNA-binding NtrC family response regulator